MPSAPWFGAQQCPAPRQFVPLADLGAGSARPNAYQMSDRGCIATGCRVGCSGALGPTDVHSSDEKTLLTFILYLNDDFNLVDNGDGGAEPSRSDGGATVFYPELVGEDPKTGRSLRRRDPAAPAEVPVIPRTGSCVVFFQAGELSPRHEGRPHTADERWKYILRSDVSFVAVKVPPDGHQPAFGTLEDDQLFDE